MSDLCTEHKQEWKASHYAKHNCDVCKLQAEVKRLADERDAMREELAGAVEFIKGLGWDGHTPTYHLKSRLAHANVP